MRQPGKSRPPHRCMKSNRQGRDAPGHDELMPLPVPAR